MFIRRWLSWGLLLTVLLVGPGCGGADNEVVAPEDPVPPPKTPLQKAPSTSKTLP